MSKVSIKFREAALRNGMIVRTKRSAQPADSNLVLAACVELANLGYVVNNWNALEGVSVTQLTDTLKVARTVVGADRNMEPIYRDFPEGVQDMDTLTLLVEQILHYWTYGLFIPDYPKTAREGLPIEEMVRGAREVSVVNVNEAANSIIEKVVTQKIAVSKNDTELLEGALDVNVPTVQEAAVIVGKAVNFENIQHFLSLHWGKVKGQVSVGEYVRLIVPQMRTTDGVLRVLMATVAAPSKGEDSFSASGSNRSQNKKHSYAEAYNRAVNHLSDADGKTVKFRNLSRSARRAVMNRIGELTAGGFRADNLVKRNLLWSRVFRSFHPYDLNLGPNALRAADIVHGNIEYRTLSSLVENAIVEGAYGEAIKLLREHNSGDLMNRVVAFARKSNTEDFKLLVETVRDIGAKSKLHSLVSTMNGVLGASVSTDRLVKVAGQTNTIVEADEPLSEDRVDALQEAVRFCIVERLRKDSDGDLLGGSVGVVSDIPVSLVERDSSYTDRVLPRGSTVEIDGEGDVVRLFGHWVNTFAHSGYMDIGAVAMDDSFQRLGVCDWSSWMTSRSWATYSGDKFVSPDDDAAEFIDVDLNMLKDAHPSVRYVAVTVVSYSGWAISEVDFVAGAMLRKKSGVQKGEVFDPRTVVSCFRPVTDSTQSIPYVFDLEKGSMIWIDSSTGNTGGTYSCAYDNEVLAVVQDEIGKPKFTYGDLAECYATAHGLETVEADADRDALDKLIK